MCGCAEMVITAPPFFMVCAWYIFEVSEVIIITWLKKTKTLGCPSQMRNIAILTSIKV